jgi:hypothetical protein
MKRLFIIPGFGGGSAPSPPPPPPPPPPRKADAAVQAARDDEIRRQKQRAGMGGTVKTSALGVTDAAATTNKTLLGN